jgi:hypothetical protein
MLHFRLERGKATPTDQPSGDFVSISMIEGKPCIKNLSIENLGPVAFTMHFAT